MPTARTSNAEHRTSSGTGRESRNMRARLSPRREGAKNDGRVHEFHENGSSSREAAKHDKAENRRERRTSNVQHPRNGDQSCHCEGGQPIGKINQSLRSRPALCVFVRPEDIPVGCGNLPIPHCGLRNAEWEVIAAPKVAKACLPRRARRTDDAKVRK